VTNRAIVEFADGEIALWDDDGVLMLKAAEPHGDPVELNEQQARELGEFLVKWAKTQRA
jgi:hypothetical protein